MVGLKSGIGGMEAEGASMHHTRFDCALITGASMGLGRAFARDCAARGMDLIITALPESGLPELGESLARQHGRGVHWLEGDLTDHSTIHALATLIPTLKRRPDLLINNAGIGSVGLFADCDADYLDATIRLNAVSLVRLMHAFLDWRDPGRKAHIINVASLGALFPMPTLAVYSATKSLAFNLSLALREELAGRVGVTTLCPNAIRTTTAVEDYVERFGLLARLACQSPEFVASLALDGAERNRAIVVPGRFNRALAFVGRRLPRSIVMKAIRHCWGGFAATDKVKR
jgi:hypothetical protein